ncbi:golgin subfamily A member 7B isoform X1 [Octodon degus]|uniref:Golgin subfamily A member 7B isoform X1 n=1 Tax=Octodon degus TaxID=10160 RepID=A0A6P6DXP8_OCTDE|nr:golgin subfamily A member 7B isoform X1 [Octodon degus]
MATEVHNLQELRRSASLATKVFIQRDYSDGTICQFQTKFPPELDSRIERQLFEETVKTLNGFYAEAEKIGGSSYLEGCLACATAYFIFLCMETHYEKVLKKISRYIQEQNEKVFAPRGLLLTDPVERGMRVPRSRSPSTRTGAAVAVPAAAAVVAVGAAAPGVAEQGPGDWPRVPAGRCTAAARALQTCGGCATKAPASESFSGSCPASLTWE